MDTRTLKLQLVVTQRLGDQLELQIFLAIAFSKLLKNSYFRNTFSMSRLQIQISVPTDVLRLLISTYHYSTSKIICEKPLLKFDCGYSKVAYR